MHVWYSMYICMYVCIDIFICSTALYGCMYVRLYVYTYIRDLCMNSDDISCTNKIVINCMYPTISAIPTIPLLYVCMY